MFTYDVAQPTDQMLLNEILDLDNGEPLVVDAFLRRDLVVVIQDRNELAGRYARDLPAVAGMRDLWRSRNACAHATAPISLSSSSG